mgnify:CR=1 FL=1
MHGRYDESELNEKYIGNIRRYDLIYENYCKYSSNRALGFCCSKAHAEEMAKEFCTNGIPFYGAQIYMRSDDKQYMIIVDLQSTNADELVNMESYFSAL